MAAYWQDIKDDNDQWRYLELQVPKEVMPDLRLQSGGNFRFKAVTSANTLFWGTAEEAYYGAWILRNDNEWPKNQMPVAPISSADIEESKDHSGAQLSAFWARYFSRALQRSHASPLYAGKWILTDRNLRLESNDLYLPVHEVTPENRVGFYTQRPLFLDWGFNGSFVPVALKAPPGENDGRVKWWRKQVRQGTCPPALIWFVSCLQAYVVLDGHARLRAFQLENQSPQFMLLKAVTEHQRTVDLERARSVHQSLEKRQNHRWKKPPSLEEVNQLLISVYDDRPFHSDISSSQAKTDMEEEWLQEIRAFEDHPGMDRDELKAMINRH